MNKTIRIIHLEDSKFDADIIKRELTISKLDFEISWVANKEGFQKSLREFSPDIVLSDHSLPSFSSLEALRMVCAMPVPVPFILITGAISEEFAVSIIKEGAADYLLKDHLQRLPQAIQEALKKRERETSEKEQAEQMLKNENRFRVIVENMPLGIFMVDRHTDIIYQNKAAEQLTGFSLGDIKGKNLSEIVNPEDLQPVLQFIHELPADSTSEKICRLRDHKNRDIWMEFMASNRLDDAHIQAMIIQLKPVNIQKTAQHL